MGTLDRKNAKTKAEVKLRANLAFKRQMSIRERDKTKIEMRE